MKTSSVFSIEINLRQIATLFLLALMLSPGAAFAQPTSGRLLTTFTSSTPAENLYFGSPLAAVGKDKVLIGAPLYNFTTNVALSYLFNTEGKVLTTFAITNATLAAGDNFGSSSVAALGDDRVLIGAMSGTYSSSFSTSGMVYLFNTNGTLLTTFSNPTHNDSDAFGYQVSAVGNNRVLISADVANSGATAAGAMYLFDTNGTLLTTFTNPIPAAYDSFGWALAALGKDRVIIAAPGKSQSVGAVYLFSTNGALLTTFTDPALVASGNFGYSVAAVGSDRVLIGSPFYSNGGSLVGAAYLFDTNGTLLVTWTNPVPVQLDSFGVSVASVGSDRVIIGANQGNAGYPSPGYAYVFSTNGTMLNILTNPVPASGNAFGNPVAAVGSDRVVAGAAFSTVGHAYLFALPSPTLNIARTGSSISLSWVKTENGLVLQQAEALGISSVWADTTNLVSVTGQTNSVQQTLVTSNRFFRLHRP